MNSKENLNSYQDAYKAEFRFIEESTMSHNFYAERLCNVIYESKAKSVLSLGIGHQIVSDAIINELKRNVKRYVIVEGSPDIIADFKAHQPNLPKSVEIIQGYFEEFNTDERFDAIEMGFILEHVDDPAQIVNIFKKFLNPGGKIFLSVPNAKSMHRQLGHLAGLLPDMYKLSPEDLQLGHKRYYDLDTFRQLVHSCGLKILKEEGIFMKPFTTAQLKKLELSDNIWRALMIFGIDHPDCCNSIYIEATI